MIYYVCKYTPIEVFAGFDEEVRPLDEMPDNFDRADRVAHANLCGFGRSVIEHVLSGGIEELVLVNCCDTMRRTYDICKASGKLRFIHLIDLPHESQGCEKESYARSIQKLVDAYAAYSGKVFDRLKFLDALVSSHHTAEDYIGLLGVRISPALEKEIADRTHLPVRNLTCLGARDIVYDKDSMIRADADQMVRLYSDAILEQTPCARMNYNTRRNPLFLDGHLKGIIYHTIKFCDFYGFEYAEIKNHVTVPLLKIETDYTSQSMGQLVTRIEAFAETLEGLAPAKPVDFTKGNKKMNESIYVAGVDSGSTSTDVVILDGSGNIVSSVIIATGGGASISANQAMEQALAKAHLSSDQIAHTITTGYGRAYIDGGDQSITEISCHAKGAHHLYPTVRTIIDIGGQDSKAIRVDESGTVQNFLMNDKCAAGTGRFLDMMSRTLGLSLTEMSRIGLSWSEDITISNMCTVFAESEVVSLVAQNKAVSDIIHGLNKAVASKVAALAARLGEEPAYMMTGGVAQNQGIVKALEESVGHSIYICEEAQLCGALGAALFALERL